MIWWQIVLGIVFLIPAAIVLVHLLFWFVFWLFASNVIEHLIYPTIVIVAIIGILLLAHGLGVWT
jgi:hypothetical protein